MGFCGIVKNKRWNNMREFTEQELVRRDKLNKIKELGIGSLWSSF